MKRERLLEAKRKTREKYIKRGQKNTSKHKKVSQLWHCLMSHRQWAITTLLCKMEKGKLVKIVYNLGWPTQHSQKEDALWEFY